MLVITITDTMHSYIIEECSLVHSFPKNSKEKQPLLFFSATHLILQLLERFYLQFVRVFIVEVSNVAYAEEVVKSLG